MIIKHLMKNESSRDGIKNILMASCILAVLFAVFAPLTANAQLGALKGIVDMVSSDSTLSTNISTGSVNCPAGAGTGACRLASLLVYAVGQGRPIIVIFAILIISVAGFRLIVSQSDDALTTARRTVLATVIGLFLLFISEQFVDALYGGFSRAPGSAFDSPADAALGAEIISVELMGILRWGETLIAIVAISLLVVQAIGVLGSFGAEDTIRKAYRAVFYTAMGIMLVAFDRVIASVFGFDSMSTLPGPPNAGIFVVEIFGFVRFFLVFVGIIVIGVMIYSGLMMLLNFGNDEYITKGKSFLINAGLGLLLIAMSFVIISTMILGIT